MTFPAKKQQHNDISQINSYHIRECRSQLKADFGLNIFLSVNFLDAQKLYSIKIQLVVKTKDRMKKNDPVTQYRPTGCACVVMHDIFGSDLFDYNNRMCQTHPLKTQTLMLYIDILAVTECDLLYYETTKF